MKNIKFLFLTDTHIKEDNGELVINTCKHAVKLSIKHRCDAIIHGGDWLDSRRQASISTIETLHTCFDILQQCYGTFYSMSGNHDKSDQSIPKSFVSAITMYDEHFEEPTRILDMIDLYPYYPEHDYPETGFTDTKGKIAICHAAFVGANNLGYKSSHGLDANWFSENYALTLVGHFHNRHKLRDNVIYTGSTAQASFGEDEFKGFTIVEIDEDGEIDIEYFKNPYSPSYVTHKVHVHVGDKPDLSSLVSDESKNHRIELIGTRAAVDGIDKSCILAAKIVKKYLDEDLSEDEIQIDFSTDTVAKYFSDFCENVQIDTTTSLYKLGSKVLLKK